MTNQEIFEMLSEFECALLYAKNRDPKNEKLKEAHEHARDALVAFAEATGCHN